MWNTEAINMDYFLYFALNREDRVNQIGFYGAGKATVCPGMIQITSGYVNITF